MKLEFSRQILKSTRIFDFMKIRPLKPLVPCGWTGRQINRQAWRN